MHLVGFEKVLRRLLSKTKVSKLREEVSMEQVWPSREGAKRLPEMPGGGKHSTRLEVVHGALAGSRGICAAQRTLPSRPTRFPDGSGVSVQPSTHTLIHGSPKGNMNEMTSLSGGGSAAECSMTRQPPSPSSLSPLSSRLVLLRDFLLSSDSASFGQLSAGLWHLGRSECGLCVW